MAVTLERTRPEPAEQPLVELRSSAWRLARRVGPFIGYVALATLLFADAWISPSKLSIGAGGDVADSIWNLAYVAHLMTHWQLNPLQTALMNHPVGVNLTWQTPILLPGLLLTPVTLLGGPILAYNVFVTLVVALTGYLTSVAVRRWVERRWVAHLAGVTFMISPFMMVNSLEHPFMAAAMVIPLSAIWVDWAIVRRGPSARRAGLVLAAMIIGEFYISEEFTAIGIAMLAVAIAILAILHPAAVRSRIRYCVRILYWSAPSILALAFPYLFWQFGGPGRISGPAMPPDTFFGDLLGFLVPGPASATYSIYGNLFRSFANWPFEDSSYLGAFVIILFVTSAVRTWRDARGRFMVIMSLASAFLILGPTIHLAGLGLLPSPAAPLWRLPLVGDILPIRLSSYLDFFVVTVFALALDRSPAPHRKRRWALLAVIALVTWLPILPYPTTSSTIPRYFSATEMGANQVLLVVPFAQNVNTSEAMLWQAASGMSYVMVDGYYTRTSGYEAFYHGPPFNPLTWTLWYLEFSKPPVGYHHVPWPQNHKMARAAGFATYPTLAELRKPRAALMSYTVRYLACGHVTAVVLGPTQNEDSIKPFLSDLLGSSPIAEGGVYVWPRPSTGWGPADACSA
jgi:hypothetical protein